MKNASIFLTGVVASWALAATAGFASNWDKLEDCRLVPNAANDGDSFHVLYDGKEYIFRLYFVDTPETDDQIPDRVAQQMESFGVDADTIYEIGHSAAEFTRSALSHHFTVYTRWTDAMGASRLPRYYAFVEAHNRDLAEQLAEEGLVRVHGVMVDGPQGAARASIEDRLIRLTERAQRAAAGIWAQSRHVDRNAPGSTADASDRLLTRDEIMANLDVTSEPAALPEVVVCPGVVPAYTVDMPYEQMGYFEPGAELTIVRVIDRSMVEVKFTAPSGKVTEASCKYWELGLQPVTAVQ
jgi:endonuclease YncB( thermonuclease family)